MNRLSRTELQKITEEGFERRAQAMTQRIYTEIINAAKQGKEQYKIRLDECDRDIIHDVVSKLIKLFPGVSLICDYRTEFMASWLRY